MNTYDRGSAVLVDVELKKAVPFGAADYFDPLTASITIYDPAGTVKINNQPLVESTVGKWYYICQTATNWVVGQYSAVVTATDGVYTDTTVEPRSFYLI